MISLFESLLRLRFPSREQLIKDIPASCCSNCNIRAFSFDDVKDDFLGVIGVGEHNKLKSVDALFIHKEKLYFIEMKKYSAYKLVNPSVSCYSYANSILQGLTSKVVDSIILISSIIGYFNIDKSFYSFFLDTSKLSVKTILLMDVSTQDYLAITMANQDKLGISLSKKINDEILIMNCDAFSNVFR